MAMVTRLISAAVLAIVVFLLLLAANIAARAHDAPAGWAYPLACCSNQDCRQAADGEVKEENGGFTLMSTGETVSHGDARLRISPDGLFHVCQRQSGPQEGSIICLFAPPGGV